jgi:hypothetical protein
VNDMERHGTSAADAMRVIEGVELSGHVNTDDDTLAANIAHSIRLGYPQVRRDPINHERVCLVGGGPSLKDTEAELRDLYYQGAKIVTVNGAYHWCLERNYRPTAQIVLDARATNARFVDPPTPGCKYLVASQCHPDTWARLEGREKVWIWHAASADTTHKAILDGYYREHWTPIAGGTTVVMRAIALLRTLGCIRMDLFGVDSCFLDGAGHAYAQPENDHDVRLSVTASPTWNLDHARTFTCAPWHLKQLEDFLQMIRINGDAFLLDVHGDGLLAFVLRSGAVDITSADPRAA